MVTVCCGCRKLKDGGRWQRGAVPPGAVVSHGYCPECFQVAKRQIVSFFLNEKGGQA